MSIAKRFLIAAALVAALASPVLAANSNGRQPSRTSLHPATFSPRNVALRYAQKRFRGLGRVSLARKPLLEARDGTHQTQAFGVTLNGKRLKQAVIVSGGGFTGMFQGVGIADVHTVKKPRGNNTLELPNTFKEAVILRVRGRNSDIKAVENLQLMAKGTQRGTKSAAFTPTFNDAIGPAIWAGPSSNTIGKAEVTSGKSKTTVTKPFSRFVIMDQDSNPDRRY